MSRSKKLDAAAHLERALIELYYARAEAGLNITSSVHMSVLSDLLKASSLIESACATMSNSNTDVEEIVNAIKKAN